MAIFSADCLRSDPQGQMLIPAANKARESKATQMKKRTFFINPFHGEELVIVHGAHVPNLTAQPLIGDGGIEMRDHDISKTEKCDSH